MDEGTVTQDCGDAGNRGIPAHLEPHQKLARFANMGEQLLPGIPNHVTLAEIAPKLAWKDCNILSQVSSTWRKAIKGRLVYDARMISSSTEIFVVTSRRSGQRAFQNAFCLYSITDKCFYHLPPFPVRGGIRVGCQCISLDGRLYVMGGLIKKRDKQKHERDENSILQIPTSIMVDSGFFSDKPMDDSFEGGSHEVYMLDVAGHGKWERCASMHKSRLLFGAVVVDGKIYVFGGNSGFETTSGYEIYNPNTNSWSLEETATIQYAFKVAPVGRELLFYGSNPCEVFDIVKRVWRRTSKGIPDIAFVTQGKFHLVGPTGVHVYDMDNDSWNRIHRFFGFALGIGQGELPHIGSAMALGDELLVVLRDYRSADGLPCLLQSQGFGKTRDIVWKIVQRDHDFDDMMKLTSSIML